MPAAEFVRSLSSEGRVRVPSPFVSDEPDADHWTRLEAALREVDAAARSDFPGDAPELSLPAATWATQIFRRACGCLVHRDLEKEDVARLLDGPCPAAACPSVCYSVDLTFRYLPDLVRLARAVSPEDPLVAHLLTWCREWPLSSVGVREIGEVDDSPIIGHPGLQALYVDRIIERNDVTRLTSGKIRDGVRRALGAHPELAGDVARFCEASQTD